jgi:predicted HTH transcriptional regulator
VTDDVGVARKGRPRSPETKARDERIVALLNEHGAMTRNQLAELLQISKSLTSIAINRLKDADPPAVRRCVDSDGNNVWTTAVEEPCP